MQNCELAPLVPYEPDGDSPWDRAAVLHLHRRLGYGLRAEEVGPWVARAPVEAIRERLAAAAALPPMARPEWAEWTVFNYLLSPAFFISTQSSEYQTRYVDDMRAHPWRAKVTVFWMDHFATRFEDYLVPPYLVDHVETLQRGAFGDFREFVRAIGRDSAMLRFLNGVENTAASPNENYARELFELFTLGEGVGYTQTDITEAARALTGFTRGAAAYEPITFDPADHDGGAKTIFGRTGAWGYDDVVDLIFAERPRECSEFVCGKLYDFFVGGERAPGAVATLAATLRASDWSLAAVYDQLFTSALFFSPALRGSLVRDPYEFIVGFERAIGTEVFYGGFQTQYVWYESTMLGFQLFNAPDVSGWPGGRSWVNSAFVASRQSVASEMVDYALTVDRPRIVAWVRAVGVPDERDPGAVTRAVTDFILPRGLPAEADYAAAEAVFRGDVPANYYEDGTWSLDYPDVNAQVFALLRFLFRRPEYNLC